MEGPKQNNLERTKDEIRREAQLIKERIDSMLNRIGSANYSASESELNLINQVVHDANHQFDKMAGTDLWRQALMESRSK